MRCVTVLIITAALATAAPGHWLRLDTQRFQIFSQTGERDLRNLAGRLETASEILDALEPGAGTAGNRVRVFIFTSRSEFERYGASKRPIEAGYHLSSAGGDVIAFVHTGAASGPVILHEYGHLAMHRAGGRLPLWLDEGLAELYGTIRIQGRQVLWGGPAPQRLSHLASGRLLGAQKFFESARNSGLNTDSTDAAFYAQTWAFTHMLRFGRKYPTSGIQEFRRLLGQGLPEEDAFRRAFSKSREAALNELPVYLNTSRFTEQPLPVAPPELHHAGSPSRCSREEVSFALADLLLQLGRKDQAGKLYQDLAQLNGSGAEASKLLGDLSLAQEKRDEALLHYQRALELGSKSAALHFEYAMLLRDDRVSPERVQQLLELALALDPNLPGLQQFLGNRALDEGGYELAIRRFTGATLLEPQKPPAWLSLSYAYRAAGNREAARDAAKRSEQLARGETEIQMAKAALEDLKRPPGPAPDRSRPKTVVPDSWKNQQGDRRVEGALVQIDCRGTSARLHLRTEESTHIFSITDPRKVVLRNAPGSSREFRCGAFEGVRIAVEFVASPESQGEVAGEVTALEFK
jgi:tetratricopeptide (TPR) repeat protein